MEPDSQELLEGSSEHADYRSKAQESVKDVVIWSDQWQWSDYGMIWMFNFKTFIIGSVNLLKRLMEVLNSSDSWDQMEAILFIVSAFVANIVE